MQFWMCVSHSFNCGFRAVLAVVFVKFWLWAPCSFWLWVSSSFGCGRRAVYVPCICPFLPRAFTYLCPMYLPIYVTCIYQFESPCICPFISIVFKILSLVHLPMYVPCIYPFESRVFDHSYSDDMSIKDIFQQKNSDQMIYSAPCVSTHVSIYIYISIVSVMLIAESSRDRSCARILQIVYYFCKSCECI